MKAYLTLLSTDDYLDGTLALYESLQMVGAKYPLVVAITNNISPTTRSVLLQKKIETIEVQDFTYRDSCNKLFVRRGMPHWTHTAAKIRIFGLTQFEKIIFLDSDMMVIKNIDHLFDYEDGAAVKDSPMLYKENSAQHEQLNSGIMVIVPSKEKEEALIELSKTNMGADQDLIRLLYSDWIKQPNLHLPAGYNIFNYKISDYISAGIRVEDFYVIHFIGKEKPYMSFEKFPVNSLVNYFKRLYLALIEQAQKDIKYL